MKGWEKIAGMLDEPQRIDSETLDVVVVEGVNFFAGDDPDDTGVLML